MAKILYPPSQRVRDAGITGLERVRDAASNAWTYARNSWQARGSRRFQRQNSAFSFSGPRYAFRDDTRLISLESSSLGSDWDLPADYPSALMPARAGPLRVRQADDYAVTLRDLFPWWNSLVRGCCCPAEPRPTRAHLRARGAAPQPAGPQLEAVCLDCGHVLEQHQLGACGPGPLSLGPIGGSFGDSGLKITLPAQGPADKLRYDGYPTWEVLPPIEKERVLAPLPKFQEGHIRTFQSVSGKESLAQSYWQLVNGQGTAWKTDFYRC